MPVQARDRGEFLDALLAGLTFIGLSLLTGRVFRFPFDDEIFSLTLLESAHSFPQLSMDLLRAMDVHPPTSYLVFYALWRLGAGAIGLRWASLLFSAGAVILAHRIAMRLVPPERCVSSAERAFVLVMIASTPLLLSQGDAIRWYPLFTLLFMACIYTYLRSDDRGGFSYAVLSGVLASTNFLGFFAFPLFELDRLWRQGWKIQWPAMLLRGVIFCVFAIPGLVTLWHGLNHDAHNYVAGQLGGGALASLIVTGIGFFGGDSLGLVQSIATVPAAVLTLLILFLSLRDPRSRILVLNVSVLFLLLAVGFGKPRSFVYFALCVSILMCHRWLMETNVRLKFAIAFIGLVTPLMVIANIKWNDTPYKRNTAIPYEEILRFARFNVRPDDAIVVSDIVLNWELKRLNLACVSLYLTNPACDLAGAPRLFIIDGYGVASHERDQWLAQKQSLLANRTESVSVFFGVDGEAALKRRLVPGLDDYILRAGTYTRVP
jgi:hypothetical protein